MGHMSWRDLRKKYIPWYKRICMDVRTKIWTFGYRRGWWV